MNISDQKKWRRERLSELLTEYGQAQLHQLTGIAEAYLFQMARGEGAQKRGVSDKNVDKIERAVGRIGWFDLPKPDAAGKAVERETRRVQQREGGWIGAKMTPAQQSLLRAVELMGRTIPDERAKALAELVLLSGGPVEAPPKVTA